MAERIDFASLPAYSAEFAAACIDRFDEEQRRLTEGFALQRMQRSYRLYNGIGQQGEDLTDIGTAGQRGEIIRVSPNRYRRLINDQCATVQQTPPDYQPETINTDPESQAQSSLAIGVLDQYKREHRLLEYRSERVEMASVLGLSTAHIYWDQNAGRDVTADAMGNVIREGDHVFSTVHPLNAAHEFNPKNKRRPSWTIVREKMLRWDVLAEYGGDNEEIADAIRRAPSWSECVKLEGFELGGQVDHSDNDDYIPVYFVYIERSVGRKHGRAARLLDARTVLVDGPMVEKTAGVFELAQSRTVLTGAATNTNYDGMPLAIAYQSQFSTIATNHDAFGLQRIKAARKSNIDEHRLAEGVSVVDYDHFDPASGSPVPSPEVMNLLNTPQEVFTFADSLISELDIALRGSPVTRGDPSATKGDSGSKTAMLFAAAQNVSSGMVREALSVDEEIATWLIGSLQVRANVPRITSIVGQNNSYTVKRFVGDGLKNVYRIGVRQADPARDTFQGRFAVAEMMQGKPREEQERLLAILNTGRVEPATQDLETERLLVERENEALRNPNEAPPVVLGSDKHMACHIHKHIAPLSSPDVRNNPVLRQRFERHIAEHIGNLTPGHPRFAGMHVLAVSGERPLPPLDTANGTGGGASMGAAPNAEQASRSGGNAPKSDTGMPDMPSMPKNAATGEAPDVEPPNVAPVV